MSKKIVRFSDCENVDVFHKKNYVESKSILLIIFINYIIKKI